MEIAAADFNDIFWEPPESEFQPLLDFENEVLQEAPHNDVAGGSHICKNTSSGSFLLPSSSFLLAPDS